MLPRVEPNLKISAHDIQEFLAFMRVGFTAATSRFDAEKMRLHGRISPGQQFHAHVRSGLQDFSLVRAHQARILAGSLEERKNVGTVEAGDAAQGGNRRAHLAALEGAEEADGDTGGARHLRKRKAAAGSQASETVPGEKRTFRWSRNNSLSFEHVDDRGGIEAAGPAKENGALQQTHVGFSEQAGAALRTLRRDQAPKPPRPPRWGGKFHAAGPLPDA